MCMYCNKDFRLDFCGHKEKLGHSFLCYLQFLNTFFGEMIGMSEYLILWEKGEEIILPCANS